MEHCCRHARARRGHSEQTPRLARLFQSTCPPKRRWLGFGLSHCVPCANEAGFIEEQGFTVRDFYERLREALERDPWCHEAVFAKIMTATADFDIFIQMMREAAETLPQKPSREEGASAGAVGEGAGGAEAREEKRENRPTRK